MIISKADPQIVDFLISDATLPVITKFATIASTKTWPRKRLDPKDIVNIMLSAQKIKQSTKPVKQIKKTLKYDKIDAALLEIKRTGDPRYINVITARKIEKKLQKIHFDDKLKLCCPKDKEDGWKEAIEYYSSIYEDESDEEYSDEFGWATDESESLSSDECWDYINPSPETTKNLVKQLFF